MTRLSLLPLIFCFALMTGCSMANGEKKQGAKSNYNSQKETIKRMSAEETARRVKLPQGFKLQVFAAEPDVQQPIGMCLDHRGRLWIAECYTYADRTKSFDRQLNDQIVILEDTNGDGKFDKRTVFWDQAKQLTSVVVGHGGVWAICAPQLLFIPDRNGDDRPDGKPIVVLDGFDNDGVRHNIANGLMWGPDGWLYGRHGILRTSFVGAPGTPRSQRTQINCGVWRYHPTRKTFEVVARGTTNPWGADWDDHGQMFLINTVIGHLFHVVPGAHFERMYGTDFDPYLYKLMPQTADHYHWDTKEVWHQIRKGVSKTTSAAGGGHAHCGLMLYLGDNWPDEFRNNVFTVNLHGRRLNRDVLERHHSAYTAKHRPDFVIFDDEWFRGVELMYGPDGGVFIIDWSDIGECHENDGVHRSSGRIFKLTYGTPQPVKVDLNSLASRELADLQTHKNDWFVRHARRLLAERASAGQKQPEAISRLQTTFTRHQDVRKRLRAMWCLYGMGATTTSWLTKQLNDRNEHVRAWAVKLLADDRQVETPAIRALVSIAAREKSDLVRLYLASALQKIPYRDRWRLAGAVAERGVHQDDPMLPLMLWYGIADAVPRQPSDAIQLIKKCRVPLIQQFIARRLTERIREDSESVNTLLQLALDPKQQGARRAILTGIHASLRGWAKVAAPRNWEFVSSALSKDRNSQTRQLIREIGIVFGDGRAVQDLRKIVNNNRADNAARRLALRSLVQQKDEATFQLLRRLVGDRVLANEAIAGLGNYDHKDVPRLILGRFRVLDRDGRQNAVTALCSRPNYADALLDAVKAQRVDRREITAFHARQITAMGNSGLTKKLAAVWGQVVSTSADKKKQMVELARKITPSALKKADASAGRKLFAKNCANCHRLFGEGQRVGPDLTGANRRNLSYLLENIVDPSAMVAKDFRMSVITLEDGRVITGVILRKGREVTEIQTLKKRVTVPSRDIVRTVPQKLSLMPDGLLKQLTGEQIRDLFAYLMSP